MAGRTQFWVICFPERPGSWHHPWFEHSIWVKLMTTATIVRSLQLECRTNMWCRWTKSLLASFVQVWVLKHYIGVWNPTHLLYSLAVKGWNLGDTHNLLATRFKSYIHTNAMTMPRLLKSHCLGKEMTEMKLRDIIPKIDWWQQGQGHDFRTTKLTRLWFLLPGYQVAVPVQHCMGLFGQINA